MHYKIILYFFLNFLILFFISNQTLKMINNDESFLTEASNIDNDAHSENLLEDETEITNADDYTEDETEEETEEETDKTIGKFNLKDFSLSTLNFSRAFRHWRI